MTLIEWIQDSLASDDEDQSVRLLDLYDAAEEEGKALRDDAFICLCGYSLKTAIHAPEVEWNVEEQ